MSSLLTFARYRDLHVMEYGYAILPFPLTTHPFWTIYQDTLAVQAIILAT